MKNLRTHFAQAVEEKEKKKKNHPQLINLEQNPFFRRPEVIGIKSAMRYNRFWDLKKIICEKESVTKGIPKDHHRVRCRSRVVRSIQPK